MKLFIGLLMLTLALVISSVAAYFSVIGLATLFAATAGAVIIMGLALEAGKLATAGWVHSNWRNPKVKGILRSYLVVAVIALMLITSLGIYGFLAKGHLEQSKPLAPIELQIANKQLEIDSAKADIVSQRERLAQLDAAINSMIGKDRAERGLRYRSSQNRERTDIQRAIAADTTKIQDLSKEIIPLKLQVNDVEVKLGPVKYVAELFGVADTESAVRIVILLIMIAFDPLAVGMVLASVISVSDAMDERRARKSKENELTPAEQIPEPEVQISEEAPSHGNVLVDLENSEKKSDKEILLDILEREPELLQNIVDVIKDQPSPPIQEHQEQPQQPQEQPPVQEQLPNPEPEQPKQQSWLDVGR